MPSAPTAEDLGHGIVLIDTGFTRPRFDAAYLLRDGPHAAFIDNGTQHSLPRLLDALAAQGLTPAQVALVIVTHVHLDHAGGTGALMQACPNARLVVHPRGARHMIDPSALIAGASQVYGEAEVLRSYGRIEPVPAERVHTPADGEVMLLGTRALQFFDTPGHARHHHAVWDARSRGWFTGDTFGISYPELATPQGRYLFPTTTPVQFEPAPLHRSVDRMMALAPERIFVTHYGELGPVAPLATMMHRQIDAMVTLAEGLRESPDRHRHLREGLLALHLAEWQALGGGMPADELAACLETDIELNAQGLGVWLDRAAA